MKTKLENDEIERYARHLILEQIDEEGQARIMSSSVLLVGVGGIGCAAALYLAASGIKSLSLVDHDLIELSNLQRQILFQTQQAGREKVRAAQHQLQLLNPGCKVIAHKRHLNADNVDKLISDVDLVIDGSDTYETRSLVADHCLKEKVPLISASASQFDGQLIFLRPWLKDNPCYRCLFPHPPGARVSCAEVGIFAPLVGLVGSMAAGEALKYLIKMPIEEKSLLLIDSYKLETTRIRAQKRPKCQCQTLNEV